MDALSALIPYITKPSRAVLTTHRNPDPDSVASICAMADLLRELGHTVSLFTHDSTRDLTWIRGADEIELTSEIDWSQYDYFWALDQAGADRHGFSNPTIPIINIDHHASNPMWGTFNYVDAQSASACSIVLKLFETLDMAPEKDTATTLLTGLMADTDFFEYAHTEEVFEDAGTLLKHGADYEGVRFQMNQQRDPRDVEFIGRALLELKVHAEKRVAYIYIDETMWNEYGSSLDKSYLLLPFIQSIQGTDCGVLIMESIPDAIRLRFRARKPDFDVLSIAQKIGGAGHHAAAGARLPRMPREEAIAKVLACF